MTTIKWKRPELGADQLGSGDAVAQLFEGRTQLRMEVFVREDLQNRVDAKRDDYDKPVRVRVIFQTLPAGLITKYFPAEFQEWYLQTETQSLKSEDRIRRTEQIQQIFSSSEFPVLVIEDFHSTGLNGPTNSRMPEKNEDNPLYHPTNALTCFFRRNGVSGKTNKKLGSAGLGRHVYYKASQISSKLVYTVPADLSREENGTLVPLDPRPLFFGQSFQHVFAERVNNHQRLYDSYYHLSGTPVDSLPMPFGLGAHEAGFVEQARTDFRLTRTPDQCGCSIIIPFPRKDLTAEALVNSIVRDFPMPILAGRLEIEVNGQLIDAGNISGLSDRPEVNQFSAFLSQAIQARPDATVVVNTERLQRPFAEDLFDEPELKQLAQSFRDHAIVCVKAEIQFGPGSDQNGSILLCVQKSERHMKGRHIVSRSGLVLSRYSDANFPRASNAVLLVQPDHLGILLRSIENPAHTDWLPGDIDLHKCGCPNELIQFIRFAHHAIDRVLANLDTEDDLNIFSDLIPAGPKTPTEPARKPPFDVQIEGDRQTFTIRPADVYDAEPGTVWHVSLIYDSVFGSGRSRKGYRPGSYDLRNVPVQITGGAVIDRGACHFDVSVVERNDFHISVGPCGFVGWADVRFHAEMPDAGNGDEP